MWLPVAIFAVTYAAMAGARLPFIRVDRPAAALCGAAAMVVSGTLTIDEALAAVDLGVLALLIGVMILAAYLSRAHFFRFAAHWILTRARSPVGLLYGLVFVAGSLSALLLNDTICLMFTPLVVAVVAESDLPPLPYLFALASATNIGGVVTFTGNPQNMIIGQAAAGDPSYLAYALVGLPIGAVCLAANAALIAWMFRSELAGRELTESTAPKPFLDRRLTAKSMLAILLFVVLAAAGISLPGAAITSAAILILVARVPPKPALAALDVSLLLFFAGLFVVVRGFSASGVIDSAVGPLVDLIGSGDVRGDLALVGLSTLGSNIVSNVPYVIVAVDWVGEFAQPSEGYMTLAIAATLAGNLTLFGSIANVIVFDSAGPRGEIGFLRFVRYGAPITIVSLGLAMLILELTRALAFGH